MKLRSGCCWTKEEVGERMTKYWRSEVDVCVCLDKGGSWRMSDDGSVLRKLESPH